MKFGKALWGAVTGVLLSSSAISAETNIHPDSALMKQVQAVNANAAILMLSPLHGFGMEEPVSCRLAQSFTDRARAENTSDAVIAAKLSNENLRLCEISKDVRRLTWSVFTQIAFTSKLPPEKFTFQIYAGDKWRLIGLFASEQDCKTVLNKAQEFGIGVKSCTSWQPRY
jgi:hypothetical protein